MFQKPQEVGAFLFDNHLTSLNLQPIKTFIIFDIIYYYL